MEPGGLELSTVPYTPSGNVVSSHAPVPVAASGNVGLPRWALLALAVLAQAGLALAMKSVPLLGMVQAAAVILLGLYAIGRRNLVLLTSLCGYLVGSEVLWRQTRSSIFYLIAPYALILLSGFVVTSVLGRLGKDARIAMFYVALLIPSVVNTVRTAGEGSRELIAFALSGPLALAAFVAFTSQVSATPRAYRSILWTTLISAVGPLTVAVSDIRGALAEAGGIEFSGQSNIVTSGGFGPVQVSAVLGLGVVVAIVLTIIEQQRAVKILAALLAFAFSVQSLLTFSRGGMFAAAIALSALALVRARDRRIRNRVLVVITIALTLGYFVVVPWLIDFTGGAFEERFTDTSSGRTELAANDLEIWGNNVVFGVGPGMTKYQRLTYGVCQLRTDRCANEGSSHTEFTRMLGEHGIPGLIAIGAMTLLAWRAVRGAAGERPFAVAFMTWAIAQMFYANLRVVAVPFAFGIAFLTVKAVQAGPVSDPPEGLRRATGAAAF